MKAFKCIQMLALRKARGIVRVWEGWVGRGVWQSLSLATDKVERILNILESLSKAIYDKK